MGGFKPSGAGAGMILSGAGDGASKMRAEMGRASALGFGLMSSGAERGRSRDSDDVHARGDMDEPFMGGIGAWGFKWARGSGSRADVVS